MADNLFHGYGASVKTTEVSAGLHIPHVIVDTGAGVVATPGAGAEAHDAPATANPVRIAARATDPATLPADVASGDVVNVLADLKGRLMVGPGEQHIGQVGGTTPRCPATYTRPADATAYAVGDLIGNSLTANLVVPISFTVARALAAIISGRATSLRCVVTPASGNLVIAALDFDFLLFRPNTNIPFAAAGYPADNAALAVSPAALRELVAIFSFTNAGWRSPAGSKTVAGIAGYQRALLNSGANYAPFNISDIASATTLVGIMQAQGIWTPGAVANQFDFALDVDLD